MTVPGLKQLLFLPLLFILAGHAPAKPLPEDLPGQYVFDLTGQLPEADGARISAKLSEFHQAHETEIIVFVINDPTEYDAAGTVPQAAMNRFAEAIYDDWQLRPRFKDWSFWEGLFRGRYEGQTYIAVVRADAPEIQLWSSDSYAKHAKAFLYRIEAQGFQPGLDASDLTAAISQGVDTLTGAVTENFFLRDAKQWFFDVYHYALLALFIAVPLGILYGVYRLFRRIWRRVSGK